MRYGVTGKKETRSQWIFAPNITVLLRVGHRINASLL